MLQFFSASTSIVNSKRAITECIEVALEGESNLDCDLIILYTAMGHDFQELLSVAHKLSPMHKLWAVPVPGSLAKMARMNH